MKSASKRSQIIREKRAPDEKTWIPQRALLKPLAFLEMTLAAIEIYKKETHGRTWLYMNMAR